MANLFCDFRNGNDSNDATTFANRVKTITSGITAARTAPGDIIRIMKSEDPVTLGINATFTNKSDTVTLASSLTTSVYLDGTWVGATNVTCTTSTTRKEGSNSSSIAIASGFTTGMAAYYATGTLNLASFNKISFWIRSNTAMAGGVFRLDLCSDAVGATAVNSITLNETLAANMWKCITVDTGGALGSSIASVSLYCISDPGTVTLLVDNIIACNDLTLTCVIGLNSSATSHLFYPIRSISGTTVKLDSYSEGDAGTAAKGYSGTTTTATIYKIEPIRITATQTPQEAATDDATRTTYSGGWDTTNMTSQTGLTFVDMGDNNLPCVTSGNVSNGSYVTFERIVGVRGTAGVVTTGATGVTISNCAAIGTGTGSSCLGSISGATSTNVKVSNCTVIAGAPNTAGISALTTMLLDTVTILSVAGTGINPGNSSGVILGNNITIRNCTTGIQSASGTFQLTNVTVTDSSSIGVDLTNSGNKIIGLITSSNTTAGVRMNSAGIFTVINPNCTDTTPFTSVRLGNRLIVSDVAGSATDTRVYDGNTSTAVITTDAATVYSPATLSFKHTPVANHTSNFPLIQAVEAVAALTSPDITFSVWVRRDSTNVGARLVLRGGQCSGVSSDQSATASAAANTWEQLSLTVSPGQNLPLIFELQSYRISGSGNVYFSNARATQP